MIDNAVSDYYLERYALGDLSEEEIREIERLAKEDSGVRSALQDIESSNSEILSLYSPKVVKSDWQARWERLNRRIPADAPLSPVYSRRKILILSSAFAAMLLLIIVYWPNGKPTPRPPGDESLQDFSLVKGVTSIDMTRTQLLIFRKINDEEVEMLSNGQSASEGDLLQLAYVAVEESFGMILSIDGRGAVTLHFPGNEGESTSLEPNRKFLLPNAIELDDAPDFERFFFLTSLSPIDPRDVLEAAEALAKDPDRIGSESLALPEHIEQHSVLIRKGGDND